MATVLHTKGTLIHFIDGKCHIKQLKSGKSFKIYLANYTWSISHHIMPLVINAFGGGHMHTHICTNVGGRNDYKKHWWMNYSEFSIILQNFEGENFDKLCSIHQIHKIFHY